MAGAESGTGERRLRAVHAYEGLDNALLSTFKGLARIAAVVADMPIASVSLVHRDRRWLRACQGMDADRWPLDTSLCDDVIRRDQPLVVEDARAHARYASSALVCEEPFVRSFIGVPIVSQLGTPIGAVVAVDTKPRVVSAERIAAMQSLAEQALAQIELARLRHRGDPAPTRSELETMLQVAAQNRDSLFAALPHGLVVHDTRGAIRYANEAAAELLGLDIDQLMGVTAIDPRWSLVDCEGRPLAPEDIPSEATARDGKTRRSIVIGVHTGTEPRRWLTVSTACVAGEGNPSFGVLATFSDITQVREVQAALRQAHEELHAIVETAQDAIITVDEAGHIDRSNASAEALFGYTHDELTGLAIAALAPPGDNRIVRALRPPRERRPLSVSSDPIEVRVRRKDGQFVQVDLSRGMFRVGSEVRWTGIFRDVTERHRIARQVSENEFRLRTNLAYDLHDSIGQLLAGGHFFAQSLLEDQPPHLHGRMARMTAVLSEALDKVRALSRSLALFDGESGSFGHALDMVASKTRSLYGIACEVDSPGECSEPELLHMRHALLVLEEAVANAARHSGCRQIVVRFRCENARYNLRIEDDGRGLPTPRPTSGLGLTTMEYRARLLGGTLRIFDGDGGGTLIELDWPM